jgi:MFS family permease
VTTTLPRGDLKVMGLVGVAHFFSHFFQLALPVMFPWIRTELGVGYAALGLVMSVFYAASGLAQTPAGFLVDRFGARRILLAGIALLAGAVGLAGLAPTYWALPPLAALAGLGNSVFHPADYSILTARVTERRLGRAYSVHLVLGNLGWAASPVALVSLAALRGWRTALLVAAVAGLAAALVLARQGDALSDRSGGPARARAVEAGPTDHLALFLSPSILACFAYFALLALALSGVQTFLVSATVALYEVPLATATSALTGYLLASGAGILVGGRLADRTARHDVVAATGMCLGAVFMLAVASGTLASPLLLGAITLAGFSSGATSPSRDMLVRAATPLGSSGRVFGFVYSGLDLGGSIGPLFFGALMDHGAPRAVFASIAVLMVVTVFTVVQVRLRTVPRPATSL